MKKHAANAFKKGISPIKILPLGFLAVIVLGTALLLLPAASHGRTTVFEALFTSVSASCVTGLVVVDTGTHFTLFGQTVILLLIQVGGLGFMTIASLLFSMLGRSISLKQRLTVAEGLGEDRLQGVIKLAINAIKFTFTMELIGAVLLAFRFIPDFGPKLGIWKAIFHSVSAFCNAGFDLMGNYSSLVEYAADPLVNFTVMALIIAGGLGFAAIQDICEKRRFRAFRLHTKLVVTASVALILAGAALFFVFEYSNPATMGSLSFPNKLLASLFQSVTCRTAGFNTVDQVALTDAGKLLSCILMFIGGAPAGTAGGIKVTTIVLLLLTVRAFMRGRADTEAFGRRISVTTIRRALCIFCIGLICAVVSITCISLFEGGGSFIDQMYEVFSALGTVGLTAGVTATSGPVARAILCALMYIGRVGMLTVALSFTSEPGSAIRYPEGGVMVG